MKTSILTAAILAGSFAYATTVLSLYDNTVIYSHQLRADTVDMGKKNKNNQSSRDTTGKPILKSAPVPGGSSIPDPKYPILPYPTDTVKVNPDATKNPNKQPVLPTPVPTPSQPNPPTSSPVPIQPGTPPQP